MSKILPTKLIPEDDVLVKDDVLCPIKLVVLDMLRSLEPRWATVCN